MSDELKDRLDAQAEWLRANTEAERMRCENMRVDAERVKLLDAREDERFAIYRRDCEHMQAHRDAFVRSVERIAAALERIAGRT